MGKCIDKIISLYRDGKISQTTIVKMASFSEELDKVGGFQFPLLNKGNAKSLGLMLLFGSALGIGSHLGIQATDTLVDKLENTHKEPKFQEMLAIHPELKSADRKLVKNYFDTMWHFSPHLAKSPFAAGAYIKQALEMHSALHGPALPTVKEMANIEKEKRDSKSDTSFGGAAFGPLALSAQQMKLDPTIFFNETGN